MKTAFLKTVDFSFDMNLALRVAFCICQPHLHNSYKCSEQCTLHPVLVPDKTAHCLN